MSYTALPTCVHDLQVSLFSGSETARVNQHFQELELWFYTGQMLKKHLDRGDWNEEVSRGRD